MKKTRIPGTDIEGSSIIFGCMTLAKGWNREPLDGNQVRDFLKPVHTALEAGINFFDHADIYGRGKSEELFSHVWQGAPSLREKIILQSKCGIRWAGDPDEAAPHRYDFSYGHIVNSVDGILKRLKTDYLDILLLHRPDPLVEPEEVARAFDELRAKGKVRHFGVSNHTAAQIALLKKSVSVPIVANQLEINLLHTPLIDEGIVSNQARPERLIRGNGALEYCRLHDISVQAWSPLAKGVLSGRPAQQPDARIANAAQVVARIAEKKNVSREAIVLAWLLRHPARIQPVIGTTNPDRVKACAQADSVALSREEWYALFTAGRGDKLP